MEGQFITEDFLLQTKTARTLYHDYAAPMPIYDYHCHLPAHLIAQNHRFDNLSQAWLQGDHYKWRAMRTNGIPEEFITGDATDWEKFEKWAATVPACLGNPLYHWTHLELRRLFGIADRRLAPDTALEIYEECSEMLRSPEFSVRNIMRKMNVHLVCTTEGPLDTLEHHRKIRQDGFEIKVHTTWRPDPAMAVENLSQLNVFIDKLEELCDVEITAFHEYIEALRDRHSFFHRHGCRLSDHGLDTAYAEDYTDSEIKKIFDKIRTGCSLNPREALQFKSAMMIEFALMDAERGWVQQLHIGALRNNCTRLFRRLGPDIGCDSIGDLEVARPLSKYLDRLDAQGRLPKTILYNLNPRDNALFATMIGNFQDGSTPGKLQYGSGWWFLDQKDGMEDQLRTLANMGLLSRFVGMLTDSRSFLSYPRHEYFRRILCNLLGNDVEAGILPNDMPLLGKMVEDICFNNAKAYFPME
ncbi:MAG TPA: glucuronate isomerase [Sedimentisphaerales bacterium]|nr:glucuronate isomerase [Phycisphaerae bacterium]HON92264.1 glucuronate isomerase [Sedimentisphaerales bacterium]HQG47900.1 glucuronate isomerase [Sedimentisphaerales bacterium]